MITIKMKRLPAVFNNRFMKTSRSTNNPTVDEAMRRNAISKAAAIRRWAREKKLLLAYHRNNWVFYARSGERISMPSGYFVISRGVMHKVVAA